jgi:tetratricopeptide (TPR) repeat protein
MLMLVEIFCCYARKDQSLLNELKIHLIPLKRQGLITIWADTDIDAGIEWDKEIEKHLDTAQIILLLISPEFIASDYCYSTEMKRAMERHECGEARVIPIILRHTSWQLAPFGKLQPLPTGAKPVISSSWHNKNVAFHDVAEGIRKTVERLITKLAEATETIPTAIITNVGKVSTSSSPLQISPPTPSLKNKKQPRGNVRQLTKHYTEILDAYEQALQLDPTDAYAYTLKGDALYDLERYEEALAAYEQAIQLDPENPYTYIFKGHALDDLECYEEALAAYEQALQHIPDDAFVQGCKSITLYDLERYEEALAACERSIELDPNDRFTHFHKGLILYALDRTEEALAAYEQSIQLDHVDDFVYQCKGDALYNLERYEEALAAYEQAIQLDPNYASAYKGKGDALYELKRYKEALAAYNRSIQLNPNDPKAYIGKANAQKQILKDQEKLRKLTKKSHNSPQLIKGSMFALLERGVAGKNTMWYQGEE